MTPGTLPLCAEAAEYTQVASQSPFSPDTPSEGAAGAAALEAAPGSCACGGGAYRARVQRARSAIRTGVVGGAPGEEKSARPTCNKDATCPWRMHKLQLDCCPCLYEDALGALYGERTGYTEVAGATPHRHVPGKLTPYRSNEEARCTADVHRAMSMTWSSPRYGYGEI
eukprot:4518809-Prymnesium_polylepis.2